MGKRSKSPIASTDAGSAGPNASSARRGERGRPVEFEGWALAFGIVGLIQFVTGLHMSLTWPIAFIAPWHNIYFGETCVAFGTLLLAAALDLWRRGDALAGLERDALLARLQRVLRPNELFVFALGLALAWIGVFPLVYPVYAAPPRSPSPGTSRGTRAWSRPPSRCSTSRSPSVACSSLGRSAPSTGRCSRSSPSLGASQARAWCSSSP